jgi:predicted secreted hydrolase
MKVERLLQQRRLLLQAGLANLLPAMTVIAAPSPAAAMQFPRDFGAHPETGLEWWYLTGLLGPVNASADDAPLFGYQLTFFRVKGPAPVDHPSRFAARQLLLAHAAISDLSAGRLRHDQRVARGGFGLAQAATGDCDVSLRDWFLRRRADPQGSRYSAAFKSSSNSGSGGAFALDLQLQTTQTTLLQGQQGLSRKGPQPQQFSHYYSQVQLQTTANLQLDGRRVALQGRSWLDHEWSDNLLGSNTGPQVGSQANAQASGWDWAGINLLDGGALTVFRLRRADASLLWSGGSWRRPDGSTQDFTPQEVQMSPTRFWRSPVSGADYPVEWALSTPLGVLQMKALIDGQEIDARLSTGMRYWEGAAELLSSDGRRLGRGYLELTGYAGAMRL